MKESHGEGIAPHTGPEFMRGRPRGRERSVDRGIGRPGIQPRKQPTSGRRRRGGRRKATFGASTSRDATESRAVRDPEHVQIHLAREPGEPLSARDGWRRGPRREVYGRTPMMDGQGQSDRPVVPTKSPNNVGQPAGGGDGGKGSGQREPEPAKRTLDTEPGRCAQCTGAGT